MYFIKCVHASVKSCIAYHFLPRVYNQLQGLTLIGSKVNILEAADVWNVIGHQVLHYK